MLVQTFVLAMIISSVLLPLLAPWVVLFEIVHRWSLYRERPGDSMNTLVCGTICVLQILIVLDLVIGSLP